VGGVYRDRGNEVASNWLRSLLRPHVKAAYRRVREDHLLPPETEAPPQFEAYTPYDPSLFSSTSSGGASLAHPSYPGGGAFDRRRLTAPRANVSQQSMAQADAVDTRRAVVDRPRSRRRRRRSSPRDGGSDDAGKFSSMKGFKIWTNVSHLTLQCAEGTPRSSTGVGSTDGIRKRLRAEGSNDG
jgi:hypothetical protein